MQKSSKTAKLSFSNKCAINIANQNAREFKLGTRRENPLSTRKPLLRMQVERHGKAEQSCAFCDQSIS